MTTQRITWTHEALALADQHGLDAADRVAAELLAGHRAGAAEVIVAAGDVRPVVINQDSALRNANSKTEVAA